MCRKVAGTEQAAKVTSAMVLPKQDARIKIYYQKIRLVYDWSFFIEMLEVWQLSADFKLNNSNQVTKSTEIYTEGSKISSIGLVVKGTVRISTEGVNVTTGPGSFLGLCDLPAGEYRATYTAESAVVVYAFPAMGFNQAVKAFIKANKDYAFLMFSSLGKCIRELSGAHKTFEDMTLKTYEFIETVATRLNEIAENTGADIDITNLQDMLEPYSNKKKFGVDSEKILYYKTCCDVSPDVQKAFLNADAAIALYNITDEVSLINRMVSQCKSDTTYIRELVGLLIKNEDNLYRCVLNMAEQINVTVIPTCGILPLLDDIINHVNFIENAFYGNGCAGLDIDYEVIEDAYNSLLNGHIESKDGGADSKGKEDSATPESDPVNVSVLNGALAFILNYSDMDTEITSNFKGFINDFINLKDKMSTEDTVRTLRRNIINIFYDLYKNVFFKDYQSQEKTPLIIDLFLKYGFVSDKLISDEIKEELLTLSESTSPDSELCTIYNLKEWLTEIYEGRKEPSKNEFDMDYNENLRDMRKTGRITSEEEQKLLNDRDAKTIFEIDNMFKANHRLVYGQVSVFVPFLYTEGCSGQVSRCFLSKDKINAAVKELLEIDFSAFYRERLYTEMLDVIKKEYIMEEVLPDFIIFPAFGNNGIMWQEISGRKRNSPGRFIMPSFLGTDINSVMIKLFGRFRWELCRTIQGASWNNIQMKSLTSEYCDFVQFYRKNRELSDDKKEKLKLQIQKCRNNTREVFVVDYENWMKLEAKGGLCLSKPAREIFAMYCPFAKNIRDKVKEQPLFRDAMTRFERERGKKCKEYDLKFRVWNKDKVEVPQEIIDTRDFYLKK